MTFLPGPIRSTRRLIALAAWLIFTISLAAWLYIFSSRQVEQLAVALPNYADQLGRHHRMLVWEASTLLLCLFGGGLVLAYYIYRDVQQSNSLRQFFMTFSHELKTAIASLQLQLEYLSGKINDPNHADSLNQLGRDISRLTLQLENSLYLADPREGQLVLQPLKLWDCLDTLEIRLPELKILRHGEAVEVLADRRALDSILLNLGYNSLKHGKATELTVSAQTSNNFKLIVFSDNGQGFRGDLKQLGKYMQRASSESGSGIGLYLARLLAQRMGGKLDFLPTSFGFKCTLSLPGPDL